MSFFVDCVCAVRVKRRMNVMTREIVFIVNMSGIKFTCHSTIPEQPAARMHQVPRAGTRSCAPAQRSCKQSSAVLLFRVHRKNSLRVVVRRGSIERNSDPEIRNHTPPLHCPISASSPVRHSVFPPGLHPPHLSPHGSKTISDHYRVNSW